MRRARVVGALLLIVGVLAPALSTAAAPPHHDVRLAYDAKTGTIEVHDRFTIEGRDRLPLGLAPWMRIAALRVDGNPAERNNGAVDLADQGRHDVELRLIGALPADTRGFADAEHLYLPAGSGWLPDTGDDTFTYRLTIETTAPLRAIATGRLTDEQTVGDKHSATIVADKPMEPPSVFIGPYVISERRQSGLRLRTYFHAGLANLAADYLDRAGHFIERFSAAIGPYPYQDFHVVSAPLPVGLGFPTLTYVGRRVLPLPFMRGRSLAHEVAHSWWGNAVGVDYASGNWAEGLTTYMADYGLAEDQGGDAAMRMRLGWLRDIAALPADRDHPVRAFVSKSHQAGQVIGYNKVAMIVHMLRRQVGDAAYARAIRRFYRSHAFATAGWDDIRSAFEASAGTDLGWFFSQWLERSGAPRVELISATVSARDSGYVVWLQLRQDPPAYRLTLPVTIDTATGPRSFPVRLSRNNEIIEIIVDAKPTRVHVDPSFETLRRLLPGESPPILRDVTLAATPGLAIVTDDAAFQSDAKSLAERLLDRPPRIVSGDKPSEPLLLIGLDADTARASTALGLSPEAPTSPGTARAWAARTAAGLPVYVVSVRDSAALMALMRPLPHYGRRSYVVFEGSRAVDKGLWPATDGPLSRALSP